MKNTLKKIIVNTPGLKQLKEFIQLERAKRSIVQIDEDFRRKKLEFTLDPGNPLQRDFEKNLEIFHQKRTRFQKVIVWGFRTEVHTHRFIHRHFHDTLIKLGDSSVLWLDDRSENAEKVEAGDLVIAMNMACKNLPYKKDVFYCLHNIQDEERKKFLTLDLQVYHNRVEVPVEKREYWEKVTFFCRDNKTLYQPWGTDLLPPEFMEPVFNRQSDEVYWIGSIWNNPYNQGNLNEMNELKAAIEEKGLKFIHLENVSVKKNIELIRKSRIAPAISGKFQVDVDYLPCRVFKNVSYGACAITNVTAFQDLLGSSAIRSSSISELVDKSLALNEAEYLEKTRQQQLYVANHHTYLNKFNNIFTAIEKLYFS